MILQIFEYGDPILRVKGKPIENIDDRIRELAANMIETMHAANGVGLAAQQIGEALQLTVLDISLVEDRPSTLKLDGKDIDPKAAMPLVLINPEIELRGDDRGGSGRLLEFSGNHRRYRTREVSDCARADFGRRHNRDRSGRISCARDSA